MMGRQDRSSPGSRHVGDDRVVRLRANNRTSSIIRWLAVIPGTRAEARAYRLNMSSTFRAAARSTISCLVSNASMITHRRGAPTWARP